MKKTYFSPEMEAFELKLSGMLCVSGAEGGNDDGGTTPEDKDPSQDGWDSDF